MLDPEVRCVVGIDVAKRGHVACALDVPSGAVRQKALTIDATAAGYAALRAALARWEEPGHLVIGVAATGCLWAPRYDAVTRAGYGVVVRNPRQTAAWAAGPGLRATTGGPPGDGGTPRRWRGGCWPATPGPACSRRSRYRRCAS
jgi:hypothetical protein